MTRWFLSSTILICLIFLIRGITKKRLPALIRYALWGLAAIRLLLPFSYTSDFDWLSGLPGVERLAQETVTGEQESDEAPADRFVTEKQQKEAESDAEVERMKKTPGSVQVGNVWLDSGTLNHEYLQQMAEEEKQIRLKEKLLWNTGQIWQPWKRWKQIFTAIWLFGAVAVCGWVLRVNSRLYLALCRTRKRLYYPDIPIPVYLAEGIPTPFLFGVFHPAIYLNPASLSRGEKGKSEKGKSEKERLDYILCHELTHYQHRDYIWAFVRTMCVALHWFNPLVWLAAACARRDSELACDEGTLRRIGREHAVSYGEVLLVMSEQMRKEKTGELLLSTGTAFGNTEMKERIVRIKGSKNWRKRSWLAGGAILLAAFVMVAFLMGQYQEAEPLHKDEIRLLGENGYEFDGFQLGDSYSKMKKRLKKSPDLKANIQEFENPDGGLTTIVSFQCLPEIEGRYNGGAYYEFHDGAFVRGKYELSFETYEEAEEYKSALSRGLGKSAEEGCSIDPGEEYYRRNPTMDIISLQTINETDGLYLYWGKDEDLIQVSLRKENSFVYGEDLILEADIWIEYIRPEWDYVGWYSALKASVSVEDGTLDKLRVPDLQYDEAIFHYIDREYGAAVDKVEWIGAQDPRWKEEWSGSIRLYNEEEEWEEYLFSPECHFLIMMDPISWAEISEEEFLRYLEWKNPFIRWEIGINDEEEIEWVMQCYLP